MEQKSVKCHYTRESSQGDQEYCEFKSDATHVSVYVFDESHKDGNGDIIESRDFELDGSDQPIIDQGLYAEAMCQKYECSQEWY